MRRRGVRLRVDEHRLTVQVDDDGCGVPSDAAPGVGLSSMRERAEEVGGALTVSAHPRGGGTRVHAVLPRDVR
jgi:signal transduction histidine kinase